MFLVTTLSGNNSMLMTEQKIKTWTDYNNFFLVCIYISNCSTPNKKVWRHTECNCSLDPQIINRGEHKLKSTGSRWPLLQKSGKQNTIKLHLYCFSHTHRHFAHKFKGLRGHFYNPEEKEDYKDDVKATKMCLESFQQKIPQ